MKRAFVLGSLLAASFLSTGCATLFHTSFDDLKVVTDPPGATARAEDVSTVTPGVLKLKRGRAPVVVRVEKEGFEPREVTVTWSRSGLVGLNAAGVGIGLLGTTASGMCSSAWGNDGSCQTNPTPLLVGAAVTAAGAIVDLKSDRSWSLKRDDLVLRLEPVRLAKAQEGELR